MDYFIFWIPCRNEPYTVFSLVPQTLSLLISQCKFEDCCEWSSWPVSFQERQVCWGDAMLLTFLEGQSNSVLMDVRQIECCQTEWACLFCSNSHRYSLISLGCQEIRKKRIGEREGSRIQATRKFRGRKGGCIGRKQSCIGPMTTTWCLHSVILTSRKFKTVVTWYLKQLFFLFPLNAESLSADLFTRLL